MRPAPGSEARPRRRPGRHHPRDPRRRSQTCAVRVAPRHRGDGGEPDRSARDTRAAVGASRGGGSGRWAYATDPNTTNPPATRCHVTSSDQASTPTGHGHHGDDVVHRRCGRGAEIVDEAEVEHVRQRGAQQTHARDRHHDRHRPAWGPDTQHGADARLDESRGEDLRRGERHRRQPQRTQEPADEDEPSGVAHGGSQAGQRTPGGTRQVSGGVGQLDQSQFGILRA